MQSFAKTRTVLTTLLVLASTQVSLADPPAGAQPAETQGGMLSSLKQAFGENLDREVVRGHFDVGSPPNTRRYYCLVDPKTGKRESNGVSGETVQRRDGMTGIKSAVVSPLSCADAEQKGMLVTADYKVSGKAATPASPPVPAPASPAAAAPAAPAAAAPPAPAAPVAAAAATAPAAPVAPPATAAPVASGALSAAATASAGSADSPARSEILAVFNRLVAALNAHDRTAVGELLLDSRDFVWAQYAGNSIWGSSQALDALEREWRGTWRVDPQLGELRVANLAADSAVLVTPLLLTNGPTTVPVRWGAVFLKTRSGWRIGSVFITPFNDWRPPPNRG
jgi:hypothetical protein